MTIDPRYFELIQAAIDGEIDGDGRLDELEISRIDSHLV